jgi:hypothetical protein
MDKNTLIKILNAASGVETESLEKRSFTLPTDGKPQSYTIKSGYLGRCYNDYTVVCVGYTGAEDEKPNGMCGKVGPSKTGVCDGVAWAFFHYAIDSGD